MSLKVYWGSGSQPSWTVLLALEAKGLSYESKLIEFSKKEHKDPEFLKINPRGKVPALVDNDYTIYESDAIVHYLDKKYPEKPLLGTTPQEAGNIIRFISEFRSYLQPDLATVVRALFFNKHHERADQIKASWQVVATELGKLEATLGQGPWLQSANPSAADFVLLPFILGLKRALSKDGARELDLPKEDYMGRFPKFDSWLGKMESLAYFDKVYPPHWKT